VTASGDGAPSGRMVLLKGHGQKGFDFYTNFDSAKGRDLAENRVVDHPYPLRTHPGPGAIRIRTRMIQLGRTWLLICVRSSGSRNRGCG